MKGLAGWSSSGAGAPARAVRRDDARTGAASLHASLARAVFAAVLLLHLVPLWLVAWLPTQEGPLHVENVLALLGHRSSALLQSWYEVSWASRPTWLAEGILAALLLAFPPVVAERLLVTGYTALFPLAFRATLPWGTRGWWAGLAAFPFVHAFPFHMGSWNFCVGLALALLAVATWGRTRGRLGAGRLAGLAALAALVAFADALALGGALVAIASALAWRARISLARARGRRARHRLVLRAYAGRAAAVATAAAPALALVASRLPAEAGAGEPRVPFVELASKLAVGYALVSIDRRELLLAAAVVFVLFVAVVHLLLARPTRGPRLRPHDGWLLAAFAFVVAYFAAPDAVGSVAHRSDRLALLALVSVAIWIGAGAAPAASQRRATIALCALALLALGVRHDKQRQLSALLDEFVSAREVVAEDRVLLPLSLSPHGPRDAAGHRLGYRVKPFLNAAGWIVAERGGVDLKNTLAATGRGPMRFAHDRSPFPAIAESSGRMETAPPCVDLAAAERAAVDYVLLWGATREALRTPCGAALAAALALRYEPTYLSEPRGLLEIWRPRAHAAGP